MRAARVRRTAGGRSQRLCPDEPHLWGGSSRSQAWRRRLHALAHYEAR
jgi:hypothetical protein